MSADDLNNQQTRDGDAVDDNVRSTPATNVTATPLDRSGNAQGKRSGQNPDETTLAPTRKNPGDLPPIVEDEEDGEIECVDVDSSSQSEPTDEDADVHPRRTRSYAAKDDSQFDNPMTEEEEAVLWDEQGKLVEE